MPLCVTHWRSLKLRRDILICGNVGCGGVAMAETCRGLHCFDLALSRLESAADTALERWKLYTDLTGRSVCCICCATDGEHATYSITAFATPQYLRATKYWVLCTRMDDNRNSVLRERRNYFGSSGTDVTMLNTLERRLVPVDQYPVYRRCFPRLIGF